MGTATSSFMGCSAEGSRSFQSGFGPRVTATPAVIVSGQQLATPHPDGTIVGSCQLSGAPCGALFHSRSASAIFSRQATSERSY
jgi:hypothetical protein